MDATTTDAETSAPIVAEAVELITETGQDIGIADVATPLGIIRQTVYRYFPNAEAVMQAAMTSVDGFLDR